MAEKLITIKVQIENLDKLAKAISSGGSSSGGGTGASGGGSSGGGSGGGGSTNVDLDEIRRAVAEFSASVRSIATSLSQANEAVANLKVNKSPSSSGSSSSSEVDTGPSKDAAAAERAATEALEAKTVATKEDTAAVNASAEAAKARAEAAAEEAKASGKTAGIMEDIAKAQSASGEAMKDASDDIKRALSQLKSVSSGKVNLEALIQNVIRPLSQDSNVTAASAKLRGSLEGFFDIPETLSDQAKAKAAEVKNQMKGIIRAFVESLDVADQTTDTRKLSKNATSRIDQLAKDSALAGVKPIEVAMRALRDAFQAEEILAAARILEEAVSKGDKVKEAGESISVAIANIAATASNAADVLRKVNADPNSKALSPGARELSFAGVGVAPSSFKLNSFQNDIVEFAKATIQLKQPLEVAREIFSRLTGDMDNFEDSLRLVSQVLREVDPGSVGGQENLLKAKELSRLVGGVKRTASGEIRGSSVAAADASFAVNTKNINDLRASLANAGPGTSKATNISVTDSAGNIRRLHVELKQFGNTVDTVRIKTKELSDNMFDRASVRTALQRVATWGAAAGLVFGAINAFKQGVDTVIQTESAVVTLGKVMDEAQADFEGFKASATEAAIAISQQFGQPIKDVLDTMILFGQQGRTMSETLELTKASALASQVTTLDQPQAASALTAAIEQFGFKAGDATSIVDKFNNVANNAAVTETQLAEALRRAGNAATNAGVDFDQFNAIVAAISEQTRQQGSEIGNALRFIFARINTEEAEKGLAKVGVAVKDAGGNIRPFIDIVGDLSTKFDTLSESQKNQVAIAVAGGHRFNSFLALVQNFDRFQDSLSDSVNSTGSAFKEQSRVAETAAFKIQQLKNSVSSAAIAFGNSFLPALKLATDAGGSVFEGLSRVPEIMQLIVTSTGLAAIAFTKFSDQAVAVADLFADGKGGLFGALSSPFTSSTTRGRPIEEQQVRNAAQFQKFAVEAPGRNIARTVGDFAGVAGFAGPKKGAEAANAFKEALVGTNSVLKDQKGQIIQNIDGITKFTAVTRGYSVETKDAAGVVKISTLGLHSLNSTFGKVAGAVVKASTAITDFSIRGRTLNPIGLGINALESAFGGVNKSLVAGIANIARLAGAVATISALVLVFDSLRDIVTRSGDSIKEELSGEISKRQEAIAKIESQRKGIDSLSRAQTKAASIIARSTAEPFAFRQESIRQGTFRDPLLEQQRLAETERKASNDTGFGNPQLIKGVDEFGNAILRSADAFEQLSTSAAGAEKRILALTQIKVIEGFIDDLKPAEGLKKIVGSLARGTGDILRGVSLGIIDIFEDTGKTVGDKFRDELSDLEGLLNDSKLKEAATLGIDVRLIDEDFSNELDDQSSKVEKAGLQISETIKKIRAEVANIPSDTFEGLLRSKDFRDFSDLEGRRLTSSTGTSTSGAQIRGQLFLQNRSTFKDIRGLIGTSGKETEALFNEKGFAGKVVDLQKNIADQLKGGELLILKSLLGVDQVEVVVNEAGERMIRQLDDVTGRVKLVKLSDKIKQGITEAVAFDPKPVRDQIERSILEIQRVVSGGARGSLLPSDLDLGVGRKFQASGQQLAALKDEPLLRDVLDARKDLETFLEKFKTPLESGDVDTTVLTKSLDEFSKLSIEQDKLDTIFRFRTELEEVGKAFEEAVDKIESSKIEDAFKAQFSGIFGAARGIIDSKTNKPLREDELSGEQIFGKLSPNLIQAANRLSQSEVATGASLAGRADLNRNIDLITREVLGAIEAGGVRSPEEASQLLIDKLKGNDDRLKTAQQLQIELHREGNELAQKQVALMEQLVNDKKNPGLLGGGLRAAIAEGGNKETLAKQIKTLTAEQINSLSTKDIKATAGFLGASSPQNLIDEVAKRNAEGTTKALTSSLFGLKKQEDPDSFVARAQRALGSGNNKPGPSIDVEEQSKFVSSAVLDVLKAQGTNKFVSQQGGELVISDASAQAIGVEIATRLQSSSDSRVSDQGDVVFEELASGNKEVIELIKSVVRDFAKVPILSKEEVKQESKRDILLDGNRIKALNKSIEFAARATEELLDPIRDTIGAFDRLGREVGNAIQGIRDAIKIAISNINTSKVLGDLASSNRSGLLAGTPDIKFGAAKNLNEFSGTDLTSLRNRNLIGAGNDFQEAFTGLRSALELAGKIEQEVLAGRGEAQSKGNLEAVAAADDALIKIGSSMDLLRAQAEGASGVLDRFGQALTNVNAVNQLEVDIRNLFTSFEKQRAAQFDSTSIDSALGRNLFSFTRPTFEQFEQGQSGFLTKFQREIEDVKFQQRSGQLNPQEARRATNRAEFGRDEELIALAQQKENKSFESEVQFAEQLRDRLLDFSFSGSAAGGQARALADALKSELEQAGDLIPTTGSRTVRDPNTGRDINVPASKLLEFRGVRGLGDIEGKVQQIAAQVQAEEQAKNASLINQPIVDTLNQTSQQQVQKLEDIVRAINENPANASSQNVQKGLDALAGKSSEIQGLATGQLDDRQAGLALNSIATALANLNIPAEDLAKVFETFKVSVGDIIVSFAEFKQMLSAKELFQPIVEFASSIKSIFSKLPFAGGVQQKAAGGVITGPGGPTSDRVPVMASPGEFIVKAAAVKKLGVPLLQLLNGGSGKIKGHKFGGLLRGYKDGGSISDLTEEELQVLAELQGREGKTFKASPIGNFSFTEKQLEDARHERLRKELKDSPTLQQLRKKEADRAARLDKLDRRGEGIRLADTDILASSGFSVVFDKDGKPTFTNAPGVGIPIGNNLKNLDLSSKGAFERELSERQSLEGAISGREKKELNLEESIRSQKDRISKQSAAALEGLKLSQREEEVTRQLTKILSGLDSPVANISNIQSQLEFNRAEFLGKNSAESIRENIDNELNNILGILNQINSIKSSKDFPASLNDTLSEALSPVGSGSQLVDSPIWNLAQSVKNSVSGLEGQEDSALALTGHIAKEFIKGTGSALLTPITEPFKAGLSLREGRFKDAGKHLANTALGLTPFAKLKKGAQVGLAAYGAFETARAVPDIIDAIKSGDPEAGASLAGSLAAGLILNKGANVSVPVKSTLNKTFSGAKNLTKRPTSAIKELVARQKEEVAAVSKLNQEVAQKAEIPADVKKGFLRRHVFNARNAKTAAIGVVQGGIAAALGAPDLLAAGVAFRPVVQRLGRYLLSKRVGDSSIGDIRSPIKSDPATLENILRSAKLSKFLDRESIQTGKLNANISKLDPFQDPSGDSLLSSQVLSRDPFQNVKGPSTSSYLQALDKSKLQKGILETFSRRDQLGSAAADVSKQLNVGRSTGVAVSEARRLGLSLDDFSSPERSRKVLGLRSGTAGITSGEIQAKSVRKGAFQKRTYGEVILDRGLKKDKAIYDDLIEQEARSRQRLRDASFREVPDSRTNTQIDADVQNLDKFLAHGALGLFGKKQMSLEELFRIKGVIERSNYATAVSQFKFGARNVRDIPYSLDDLFSSSARNRGGFLNLSNRRLNASAAAEIGTPSVPGRRVVSPEAARAKTVNERRGKQPPNLQQEIPPQRLNDILKNPTQNLPNLTPEEMNFLIKSGLLGGGFASGGRIFGPGGPKSDKVPILASNGEFVLSASSAKKIGTPMLDFINKTGSIPFGALPKFAEGGSVSNTAIGGTKPTIVEVKVPTEEISAAIREAIEEAISGNAIPLDTGQASTDITNAIAAAFQNIQLPEIEVNVDNVSVPLEIPTNGLPLDVSALRGLDLGENLGAGVRNRLEAVEGSVSSLREDTNGILDNIEGVNFEVLSALPIDLSEIKRQVDLVPREIETLNQTISTQRQQIMDQVFTMINEQISNLQNDNSVSARLDKYMATNEAAITNISNRIAEAMSIATRALSQALARI